MNKEAKMTVEGLKDIIYVTTQYLDLPDEDIAILNARLFDVLAVAMITNNEKKIKMFDKIKLTKDEIIKIIRDNLKFSLYGLANYTMVDSFEKIADVIIERNNEC